MNPYINDWLTIIDSMNNTNTYKLAWGRALIEICYEMDEPIDDYQIIHFDLISHKILKYFWNQTYFFKLSQGPTKQKPIIQQIVEEMIIYYQNRNYNTMPIWFDDAYETFFKKEKKYRAFINRTSNTLKKDVSYRFVKVDDKDLPIYLLDLKNKTVNVTKEEVFLIKEHAFVLSQLLNYRWAQLLEKFNTSPRITMKVQGISEEKIRRNSLKKFKDALLKQFPDGKVRDFYTDELLDPSDISIDHVIPWSFMYSDDIWNLVITSKSKNSSKSNTKTNQAFIDKLKVRNKALIEYADDKDKLNLEVAEKQKLIDRYYFEFKI